MSNRFSSQITHPHEVMHLVSTLADFFVPMEKYVPSALVSPENLLKCSALAQAFPAGITRLFGFERILNEPDSQIGFAFSILPGTAGWAFLVSPSDSKTDQSLPRALFDTLAWARIKTLCSETENSDSLLHNLLLEGFWVEYDIGRIDAVLSSPDFFLPFKLERMKIVDPRPVVARLFALLLEKDLSPQIETNLIACMKRLPSVAEINQLGAMMGRSSSLVRMVVTFPNVQAAADYLRDIGWQDDYGSLAAVCSWYANLGDTYTLQIDFNDTAEMINPRIGLESRFTNIWESAERWRRLYDAFEQQGLCLPEERMALQNFPRLVRTVVLLPMVYILGVSHLKVVLYPDREPQAKAYFGAKFDISKG